jgi:hypothetical protein
LARSFTRASSNYASSDTTPVTAVPLTMACWFYPTDGTTYQQLMGLHKRSDNGSSNFSGFFLEFNGQSTDYISATTGAGAAASTANSTAGATLNAWNHGCAVYASATSRTIYLNGGNSATNTASRVPSGVDSIAVGHSYWSTRANFLNGRLADAAIWNVALSATEAEALARGVSPLRIRPGNLVAYWPIFGTASPEIDVSRGAYPLTLSGTAVAEHAPVMAPFGGELDWTPYVVTSGAIAASVGIASTLVIGTSVAGLTLAASTGQASTLTIGTPVSAATLAASTGIASTASIGPPVATLTLSASAGLASGLVIGTPGVASTLAASIGIASTLTIGTLVANVAGGPLGASVGIASTLILGTPVLSGSLGAGVGIASTLTVGTPVAGLTLPASVGVASGLVIGSPTASINQAAIVGMASTMLIGPPVASGSFATLAGPTQITTTLVQDGPRSNALTQLGPDPHNTFGAA